MLSIRSTPHPVDRLLQDAAAALQARDPRRAAAAARQATEQAPQRLEGWWLWSLAAMELVAYAEADRVLENGMAHIPAGHPLRARFLVQRVRALCPLGRFGEACDLARRALAEGVAEPDALYMLGTAFGQAGRESEALPVLRRAAELSPQAPAFRHGLAEIESFLGLTDAAEANYEAALHLAPNSESFLALSRLRRWTPDRNHIAALKTLSVTTPLDEARRAYALFKELDDIGDHDEAWTWLERGAAAARRQPVTAYTHDWSRAAEAATVAAWKTHLPAGRFRDLPERRATAPRRIFIVGLPRSGTTLTERILAAHSQVQALGELQTFGVAVKRLSGSTTRTVLDADTIARASVLDPAGLATFYDRETAYQHDGRACTIDKLPYNHDYAGLIRLAFPDAAIVHVRRNPMDSLFGAYRLHVANNYRWSFDQDDLADHYALYRELMEHWRTVLGPDPAAGGLVDVSLEALIADPEAEIRRLLVGCGLPFEAACLAPHAAGGAVASASSAQVRRPINADGVGAWRRYATQLEPLKQRLVAMGAIDDEGNPL